MILRPEAQSDAYSWLATLGGHAAIGVGGWIVAAWLMGVPLAPWAVAIAYGIFEVVQLFVHRELISRRLIWDSALDWVGVVAGTMVAAYLWAQEMGAATAAALVVVIVAERGICARLRRGGRS